VDYKRARCNPVLFLRVARWLPTTPPFWSPEIENGTGKERYRSRHPQRQGLHRSEPRRLGCDCRRRDAGETDRLRMVLAHEKGAFTGEPSKFGRL